MSATLSSQERQRLLRLARTTVADDLASRPESPFEPSPGAMCEPRGAFVTLKIDGTLRGCIGHVIAAEPLWRSVRDNARSAAFSDPRFPPLEQRELIAVRFGISALTPLVPIDGPHQVQVGRHGLMVRRGAARGLLLPQVAAELGWTRAQFLSHTCRKAGLAADAWRDGDLELRVFEAEVFQEDDDCRTG